MRKVKEIYEKLSLDVRYTEYEAQQYDAIMNEIKEIRFEKFTDEVKELLIVYVNKIFKRKA